MAPGLSFRPKIPVWTAESLQWRVKQDLRNFRKRGKPLQGIKTIFGNFLPGISVPFDLLQQLMEVLVECCTFRKLDNSRTSPANFLTICLCFKNSEILVEWKAIYLIPFLTNKPYNR